MAIVRNIFVRSLIILFTASISSIQANVPYDIILDENAKRIHQIDCLNILVYVILLILTVCTVWFFKRRRFRFLHETGLAIFYGKSFNFSTKLNSMLQSKENCVCFLNWVNCTSDISKKDSLTVSLLELRMITRSSNYLTTSK